MLAIPVPIGVNRLISTACVAKIAIPHWCGVASNTVRDRERAGPGRSMPLAFARQCAPAILVRFAPEAAFSARSQSRHVGIVGYVRFVTP